MDASGAFRFSFGLDRVRLDPAWTYVDVFGDGLGGSVGASVVKVGGRRKGRGLSASNHVGGRVAHVVNPKAVNTAPPSSWGKLV